MKPPPYGGRLLTHTQWIDWVRSEWPNVHVTAVETRPAAPQAGEAMTCRVCVHLGALAPADVNVALVPGPAATAAASPEVEGVRLWSESAYGNGCFLFEAEVPRTVLEDAQGCSIRIAPDRHRVLTTIPPVLHHVAAPVGDRPQANRAEQTRSPGATRGGNAAEDAPETAFRLER
jgi:hypothetical protein